MPTLVTFYALSESKTTLQSSDANNAGNKVNALEQALETQLVKAAELSLECVSSRKKTTVLCASQAQAEAFDELIWQYPPDQFIPHNLHGEGPEMGTPLEIVWLAAYKNMTKLRNRSVLICLSQDFFKQHQDIQHIIDFVPVEEEAKAQARQRYKQYKAAGCQLEYKTA